MKKPILVLLSLLLFTSCGGGGSTNYLSHQTYPLEARGVLEYDGHRYTVGITVSEAEEIKIEISEPEIIAGTVFSLSGGKASVSYGGITADIADSYPSTDRDTSFAVYVFADGRLLSRRVGDKRGRGEIQPRRLQDTGRRRQHFCSAGE